MRKPSIELLSEVLGEDVIIFEHPQFPHGNGVRYRFNVNSGRIEWINVYKLMHLMKVWALKNKYNLLSYLSDRNDINEAYVQVYSRHSFMTTIYGDTEHEAVTKACEWILEHKKELEDENGSKDNS